MLSSVIEAVIGAVYLGCGYDRVAAPVVAAFAEQIDEALNHSADFKSVLQERVARRGAVIDYAIVEEAGPPHDRHFVIAARGQGRGDRSRRGPHEEDRRAGGRRSRALERLDGESG